MIIMQIQLRMVDGKLVTLRVLIMKVCPEKFALLDHACSEQL